MKLSSILSIFVLLTVCSTALFGEEDFYTKYNQPRDAWGSPEDFKKFWNTGECSGCNLEGFDLREVIKKHVGKKIDLERADCSHTNLSNVNMSGANLGDGKFNFANLEKSILENANAIQASFLHANMFYTNMRYAEIYNAKFRHACLWAANFYGAKVNLRTAFRYANCRGADFRNLVDVDGAPGKPNFKEAELKDCKIDPISLHSSLLLKIAYRINRSYDSHPKPVL